MKMQMKFLVSVSLSLALVVCLSIAFAKVIKSTAATAVRSNDPTSASNNTAKESRHFATCYCPELGMEIDCLTCGCMSICTSTWAILQCDEECCIARGDGCFGNFASLPEDAQQMSRQLTELAGRSVVFDPFNKSQRMTLDFKEVASWTVLEKLQPFGRVIVGGVDFEQHQKARKSLNAGEMVHAQFHGVKVKSALGLLSFITGQEFQIDPNKAEKVLNIEVERATLDEIITLINSQ